MNWDNPEERLALAERVGTEEYNRRLLEHLDSLIVATVKGRAIRPVNSPFGRLFAVGGTKHAFSTVEEAVRYAEGLEEAK